MLRSETPAALAAKISSRANSQRPEALSKRHKGKMPALALTRNGMKKSAAARDAFSAPLHMESDRVNNMPVEFLRLKQQWRQLQNPPKCRSHGRAKIVVERAPKARTSPPSTKDKRRIRLANAPTAQKDTAVVSSQHGKALRDKTQPGRTTRRMALIKRNSATSIETLGTCYVKNAMCSFLTLTC
jgi:hypothetical protein